MNNARAKELRVIRLKLIFTAAVILLTAVLIRNASALYAAAEVSSALRRDLLRTSYDPESYSVFEVHDNTISARGKYSGDRIRKMYIEKLEDTSGSYYINVGADGSYDAELKINPPDIGEYRLCLKQNSGAVLNYLIYYGEKGWYFPDNGLSEPSRAVFEHIYEAPAQAAALYLSPTASGDEIGAALEQIRLLTGSVTEGIEDDYRKALAISRFIADTFYYDHDARHDNVDIETIALCNVLKTERTVCSGFANLFCAMAEAAGIDAVNIKGGVTSAELPYSKLGDGVQNHEWAAFWYEKEERWVWADACWDGAGDYKHGEYKQSVTKEMYFDITDEALSLNHRADKAERRHYFSAVAQTAPIVTSEQNVEAVTDTGEALLQTSQSTPSQIGSVTLPRPAEKISEEGSDTVYYVIIAVLAVLIIAAAAFLIIIRIKGKNTDKGKDNENGNN